MNERKIDERSFDFALMIVEVYKFLLEKKEFVLSKQLLRSGTSIGANVHEAQAAQSRKDFASKMAIASKEARETLYWLRLLDNSGEVSGTTFNNSITSSMKKNPSQSTQSTQR